MAYKRAPWMKFDPLKVAVEVAELDRADQGAYFMAILRLWASGPLDKETVLKKYGQPVLDLMQEAKEGWSFDWLEEARAESQQYLMQQSTKGKKGAAAKQRLSHGQATAEPRLSHEDEDEEVHEEDTSPSGDVAASAFGWPQRAEVITHMKGILERDLDGTTKDNDRFCGHLLRKLKKAYPEDDPVQKAKDLITYGRKTFLGPSVTSIVWVYRNYGKLIDTIKREVKEGKIKPEVPAPAEERHFYPGYGPNGAGK